MNSKVLLIAAGLFFIGVISAIPPLPSLFYGDANVNGTALPDGYFITAKIDGVVSGECPIIGGTYGIESTCIIISYDNDAVIDFYIGDTQIGESDFLEGEKTTLDFDLETLPNYTGNSADGVCDVDLGECYFNLLDCGVEVTTACAGNGVCDSLMGETCANTPGDCGTCTTTTTTNNGGSSSGGGGGGSSNNVITLGTNDEEDMQDLGTAETTDADSTGDETQDAQQFGPEEKGAGSKSLLEENPAIGIGVLVLIVLAIIFGLINKRMGQDKRIKQEVAAVVVPPKKKSQKGQKNIRITKLSEKRGAKKTDEAPKDEEQ